MPTALLRRARFFGCASHGEKVVSSRAKTERSVRVWISRMSRSVVGIGKRV